MPLLILLLLLIVLVGLYMLLQGIEKTRIWMRNRSPASEECPACRQYIVVGKTPASCPSCGVKLTRNVKGELMIRLN